MNATMISIVAIRIIRNMVLLELIILIIIAEKIIKKI